MPDEPPEPATQEQQDALLVWHADMMKHDPGYAAAWIAARSYPAPLRPLYILRLLAINNHTLMALIHSANIPFDN